MLGETSFSWRQAALDGVMAGATAGMANTSVIGNAAKKLGGSAFVRGAVSSVTTNLTSQAAQRLVGMETHFSWKSIAASAVSGGIAQMVTPALTAGIRTDEGLQAASGIIGGVIGLHTRRSFGFDNPINYGAIMADAFGNMLATSVTRNMSASGTGDRVTDKLHGINADLQAKLEAKAGALVDGYLDTRLARCQSDMTFPEWEISGSDRTRSTVIKTVAPPLRYQSSDGQLWSDIPKVRRSTDFKDVATGQITNAVPDVMVVRDTRTSQHFMQQWEHAYRYNLPAPTQASWGYLEARRQALDGILRPAYNAYASERIAFTQAQMPQPVVQRYMTNAEFSAWRKQDNFSFLKFMGGTALMGVLPAVATASPLVGAAMSGWSIGSGVNSFRDGNYVQGSLELAGGLLGLGVAGVQIRAATTVKQAMYMPLGSNGTAGALSAEVRTWEDLGVRSVRVGDAAPSTTINVSNSRVFSVDRTMHAADEAAGVLANGSYIRNPSARNLTDMVTESGRIGGKQTNGQFMYVIDRDGTIIVGSRSGQRMPHPTLVGGENPQVLGAGIVDIRGGKIYSVDNASGHFKPGPGSLDVARNTFGQLPPNVFRRDFQGYLPYKPGGN